MSIVVSMLNLIITLSSIVDKYSRRDSNPQISIRSAVFFPLDYPSSTPDRTRTCISEIRNLVPHPLGYGRILPFTRQLNKQ